MPLFIRRALTTKRRWRLLVPLVASGEYLGFLSVGHAEPSPAFTLRAAIVMVMARFSMSGMSSMNMDFPFFTA
jgi:hypothetical protein